MSNDVGQTPPAVMNDAPIYKTSRSSNSSCVEVSLQGDYVLVRDSNMPYGPVLKFTVAEWVAFVEGVIAGEFMIQ